MKEMKDVTWGTEEIGDGDASLQSHHLSLINRQTPKDKPRAGCAGLFFWDPPPNLFFSNPPSTVLH